MTVIRDIYKRLHNGTNPCIAANVEDTDGGGGGRLGLQKRNQVLWQELESVLWRVEAVVVYEVTKPSGPRPGVLSLLLPLMWSLHGELGGWQWKCAFRLKYVEMKCPSAQCGVCFAFTKCIFCPNLIVSQLARPGV